MDTTIPVNSVMVVVSSSTGTAGYAAQVNGKYFAAQIPVTADVTTISAIATDQTGTQHQASVSVTVETLPDSVTLSAAPSVGIMTLKQSGQTSLDVALMSTPAMTAPVASYAWDFSGTGSNNLTCYNHSNVTASYQQVGLYLTQVAVTDLAGNTYRHAAIVNVLDLASTDALFKQIWGGMKGKLESQDIEGAVGYFNTQSQDRYREIFTALSSVLPGMAHDMQDIQLVYVNDNTAKYRIRKNETYGGQTMAITYYIYFTRNDNGLWTIDSF
jgi:hypothetical protein